MISKFLLPTATIDSDHPRVITAAIKIAGDAVSDEEKARRCFEWVRDSVRHSADHSISVVTCTASDVLEHKAGFCYAKSNLLAALLRALNIPAALSYQRLSLDSEGTEFFLHGLVSVYLEEFGWYRIDPRGNKAGVTSDFCPPVEKLPYIPKIKGERDIEARLVDTMSCVVTTLERFDTAAEVRANLPDEPKNAEQGIAKK